MTGMTLERLQCRICGPGLTYSTLNAWRKSGGWDWTGRWTATGFLPRPDVEDHPEGRADLERLWAQHAIRGEVLGAIRADAGPHFVVRSGTGLYMVGPEHLEVGREERPPVPLASVPRPVDVDTARRLVAREIEVHGPKDVFGYTLQALAEVEALRSVRTHCLQLLDDVDYQAREEPQGLLSEGLRARVAAALGREG